LPRSLSGHPPARVAVPSSPLAVSDSRCFAPPAIEGLWFGYGKGCFGGGVMFLELNPTSLSPLSLHPPFPPSLPPSPSLSLPVSFPPSVSPSVGAGPCGVTRWVLHDTMYLFINSGNLSNLDARAPSSPLAVSDSRSFAPPAIKEVVKVSPHESATFRGGGGHFCGKVARLATRQHLLHLPTPGLEHREGLGHF